MFFQAHKKLIILYKSQISRGLRMLQARHGESQRNPEFKVILGYIANFFFQIGRKKRKEKLSTGGEMAWVD